MQLLVKQLALGWVVSFVGCDVLGHPSFRDKGELIADGRPPEKLLLTDNDSWRSTTLELF